MTAKSTLPPHLFALDPDVPPDPLDRRHRGACSVCHRMGAPGDAHHTLPDAPEWDARRAAAGENGGEG